MGPELNIQDLEQVNLDEFILRVGDLLVWKPCQDHLLLFKVRCSLGTAMPATISEISDMKLAKARRHCQLIFAGAE